MMATPHFLMMNSKHLKVCCTHEHIHLKWVANFNDYNEQVVFIMNNEKVWAMCNDPIKKVWTIVIWNFFQTLIFKMKLKCSSNLLTQFWICLNVSNFDVLWILGFQTNGFFKIWFCKSIVIRLINELYNYFI